MPVRLTAVLAAGVIAVATLGCGGGSHSRRAPAQVDPLALGTVQIVGSQSLRSGGGPGAGLLRRPLPARFDVSMDVVLSRGATFELDLGAPGSALTLARPASGPALLRADGSTYPLPARPGWGRGDARHIELTNGALAVDGKAVPRPPGSRSRALLALSAVRGRARVSGLIITDAHHHAALLLHRLAELHARVPPGALLAGSDRRDRLHFRSIWTSGFFAGALWQAASLVPEAGLFANWALAATLGHLGLEHAATPDVGFMYGQSSLLAWRHLCRAAGSQGRICARLRNSVVGAADELTRLAATNPGAGTIPTSAASPVAQTIVDSMMNITILPWASRVTGQRSYRKLASHQAHVIGSLLVRPDGSTFQAVHFDRSSGRIVFVGTHQGIADASTWSRGQAWGLYGFAQAAQDLHDAGLLAIAQQLAGYVSRSLAAGGVPPWDYSARAGRPIDVSAGVIQAAGLLHLLLACNAAPGTCADTSAWGPLSRTLLTAALGHASTRPPLGLLSSQVLNGTRPTCCNGGELIFGLSYALESLALERRPGG
ncbi:MAG: hypothetical protein ACR2JH_02810 [Solirubrobacteraceae bacterium]